MAGKMHSEFNAWFESLQANNILFMFKGDFNQELINSIVQLIEGLPELEQEDIIVRKRMSGAVVECLQNICRHGENLSETSDLKPGMLLLRKRNGEYVISIGNNIKTSKVSTLRDYIDKVNGLDDAGLKEFHKDVLINTELFGKFGADLGLINIARKSSRDFDYDFREINDTYSFFSFEVSILATEKN